MDGGVTIVALYTAISVCTGIGGLDHGINRALDGALRNVLMVEGEAFSASGLAAQMENDFMAETAIWSDLRTITSPECSAYVRRALGDRNLDMFFGGIPCQPWSVAGKQVGADDDRDLWPASLEAIGHYEPGLVLIENVSGFASEPMGLRRVAANLTAMGYAIASGIFTSSEVGGIHQRKRCFVMGFFERTRRASSGPGRQQHTGPQFETRSGELDDAPSIGWTGFELSVSSKRNVYANSFGRSARMADADNKGPQGRVFGQGHETEGRKDTRRSATADSRTLSACPGRNEYGVWAFVARNNPDLLPALSRFAMEQIAERNVRIRIAGSVGDATEGRQVQDEIELEVQRMADEHTDRAHCLRAIGNAVDERVAEYAFVTLAAVILEQIKNK